MNDLFAQLKPYRWRIGAPLLASMGMLVLTLFAASEGRRWAAIIGACLTVSMFVRAIHRLTVAARDIAGNSQDPHSQPE